MSNLPAYLKQGEPARLFPVLADTSREGRLTSIFLSILPQIPSLSEEIFKTVGLRVGKRTRIETFTEIVFSQGNDSNCRPDGLIVINSGKTTWTALVEAKIGKAKLDPDQVMQYLDMAKANGIDAVITISNTFVAKADHSPVAVPKTLLRRVGLFHWSWTWIATQCEILNLQDAVEDRHQAFLLEEILRLLTHQSTGIERFSQMGPEWKGLVQSVSNNTTLKKSDPEIENAVGCWFEEVRDLGLQLARHVGQPVETILERRFKDDPVGRLKAGIAQIVETQCLSATYRIPDSAADIDVSVDLARKTVTSAMKIKAPLDRKSTKARVNWVLRMLKDEDPRILIRAHWPGRAAATQAPLAVLRDNPEALQTDNRDATPHAFEVLLVESLGKRFSGRRSFIEDVERLVPVFYDFVGQYLQVWQAPPPRPVKQRELAEETAGDDPGSDVAALPQPDAEQS